MSAGAYHFDASWVLSGPREPMHDALSNNIDDDAAIMDDLHQLAENITAALQVSLLCQNVPPFFKLIFCLFATEWGPVPCQLWNVER